MQTCHLANLPPFPVNLATHSGEKVAGVRGIHTRAAGQDRETFAPVTRMTYYTDKGETP